MIPALVDHKTEALALLTDSFKGRPVVEGILKALTKAVQHVEDETQNVITQRLIDTATGNALDTVASMVEVQRAGRGDEELRALVRLTILANSSDGRVQDIIDFAKLSGADSYFYIEGYPKNFTLYLYNVDAPYELAQLLARTREAGVSANLAYTNAPKTSFLRLGSVHGGAGGGGLMSVHGGTTTALSIGGSVAA